MGGDHAPDVNIQGALLALEDDAALQLTLVGDRELLLAGLKKRGSGESPRLQIVHSSEVISMDDHATVGVRKKKDSSIHVGLRLLKDGKADAFISAGNSGAVMAGALLILGRVAEVERPAIIVRLPTVDGWVVLLDAGANVDCRPSHLAQFAQMGHVYAEIIEGIQRPRISLLSNGSESHKGNELTRESDAILKKSRHLNYLGYVEGHDLFRGVTDVVVCDGFVGNVTLKLAEGLAETAFRWFRDQIRRDVFGFVGVVLLRRILKNFKRKFDYQPYGAAPLLGINGMVLISHGGSTELAIRNGILTAQRGVKQSFVQKITEQLEKYYKKEVRGK